MMEPIKCPACTSEAMHSIKAMSSSENFFEIFACPVCGRFELKWPTESCQLNRNHLASYLIYHCYPQNMLSEQVEYRYHTVRDKEFCDYYRENFDKGHNVCGRPVHMDSEMIENWYPKTFADRVDKILLYLANHTEHIGQILKMPINKLVNVLFVDKQKYDDNISSKTARQ